MWQEERYRRIRALLSALQSVSTDRIVNELDVSRETVRRDLVELEALGELRRVHGGVVAKGSPTSPAPRHVRTDARLERAIAKAAAALLSDGQTVFMDAGAYLPLLAEELAVVSGLTVITNSFDVAMRLRAPEQTSLHGHRVVVLGGSVAGQLAATQGDRTVAEIHRYRADVAMLAPTGVDARHGATHHDLDLAEVARAMVANASQVILLADHAKVGVSSRVSYCPADRISRLVSNRKAEGMEGYEALAAVVGGIVLA